MGALDKYSPPGLLGAVRERFGLSQVELAGLLGVGQPKVNDAEAGPYRRPVPAGPALAAGDNLTDALWACGRANEATTAPRACRKCGILEP